MQYNNKPESFAAPPTESCEDAPGAAVTDQAREANSSKITKFGTSRKRPAKLRTVDDSRTLAVLTHALGGDFAAIEGLILSTKAGSANTKYIKGLIRSWLKSRYWGQAMILDGTHHLPPPSSLPKWRALPPEVAQFFKLLFVLEDPDAIFVTIRLDQNIGDDALDALRGPCDWLADRIKRALREVGCNYKHLAFCIEYAPGKAKTLHRLHIHGAMRIPPERRNAALAALKSALAPNYKTHGKNHAVKFEEPRKATDVARYAPKEAALTEGRILSARGKKRGSSAHRASQAATAGGSEAYLSLNRFLYGNPFSYAGIRDFS
jgi:hypothetical protein